VFGLAAMASTLVAAAVRHRLGDRRTWIAANLLMAAGVAVPLAWNTLAATVVSALLVGGTFMVVTMAGMQEARRMGGADAPRLMAAMTAAFATCQIAGPVLVALLGRRQDAFALPLALAALVLLASAAWLAFPDAPLEDST
jgi:predicted MFS family arabinose efflux permease